MIEGQYFSNQWRSAPVSRIIFSYEAHEYTVRSDRLTHQSRYAHQRSELIQRHTPAIYPTPSQKPARASKTNADDVLQRSCAGIWIGDRTAPFEPPPECIRHYAPSLRPLPSLAIPIELGLKVVEGQLRGSFGWEQRWSCRLASVGALVWAQCPSHVFVGGDVRPAVCVCDLQAFLLLKFGIGFPGTSCVRHLGIYVVFWLSSGGIRYDVMLILGR